MRVGHCASLGVVADRVLLVDAQEMNEAMDDVFRLTNALMRSIVLAVQVRGILALHLQWS